MAATERPAADELSAAEDALSSAQARMWFLHALDPNGSGYTVAVAHRLAGALVVPALHAALRAVARRHEMLRSTFPAGQDGRPRRAVAPDVVVEPVTLDCSSLGESERDGYAQGQIAREAHRPFDVQCGPLYRLTLVRFSPCDHLLVTAFHHIIMDGWSLGVWHREVQAAYDAALRGEALPNAVAAATMSAVVRRERAFLESEAGRKALDAVTETLRDAPMLELPMARPRPRIVRFAGARLETVLTADVVRGVDALARATRSSRFMVLTSALAILLHRYSGQRTLLLGSPVANRPDPALEHVIGLFVNTVVLRIDLDRMCSTRDVIARVRAATIRALEYQAVPFDRVVEALAPGPTLSHNPLFQVMCALQNAPAAPLRLSGLDVTPLPAGGEAARFDLECTGFESPDQIRLRLIFNTDVIDGEVAARFLSHLQRILQAGVDQPDLPIDATALLTGAESAAQAAFERGPAVVEQDACVHELFEACAARTPGAAAISDGRRTLSFREIDEWSSGIAHRLQQMGVATDEIVGVCVERTVALPAAILGVWKSGAALLPLEPRESVERRAFMLRDAGVSVVVASDGLAEAFRAQGAATLLVEDAGGSRGYRPRAHPAGLAYVIYTSGTTGHPKGVQVEHRNLVNTLRACQDLFAFRSTDCGLVLAASTFDVFYYELFAPILGGGRARVVSREDLLDPAIAAPLVASCTCFQAVPGVMEHLLAALVSQDCGPCRSVRLAMTGGDLVPPSLFDSLNAAFPEATVSVTYGPTEAAIFCTCFVARPGTKTTGHPIGRPLPGTIVRVCDDDGRSLPVNVNGEIWVGGAGIARGYLNREAETAERFVERLGERFYRTGDRGRCDRDGTLEFVGRSDRQVKIRGFRIEPAEIEAVLAQAPGIAQAAVRVLGSSHSERRLAGYIALDGDVLGRQAGDMEAGHVAHWREIFERVYATRVRHVSGDSDFTGWNGTLTGLPLPLEDLDAWVAASAGQIVRRAPPDLVHARRLRVLEIGCGTGLVLLRLAPLCNRYVGTDFSPRALADVRQKAAARGLDGVELYEADALAPGVAGGEFDIVVINSVVQYLPNAAYLRRLLSEAVARTRRGGFVFVGDVRNLALLETFHAMVETHRAGSRGDKTALARARRRAEAEAELLLHPAFLPTLVGTLARVSHFESLPRGGGYAEELRAFRFDAVLWCDGEPRRTAAPQWEGWGAGGWTIERLRAELARSRRDVLALARIPDRRSQSHLEAHRQLARAAGEAEPPRAPGAPASVDDLCDAAAAAGYAVRLSVLRGGADGSFDAYFERGEAAAWPHWPADPVPPTLATDPVRAAAKHALAAGAHRFLVGRLADYMVPATLTVLDSFPRTLNGKLDLDRLPDAAGVEGAGAVRRPPETDHERAVAAAWSAVLGQRVWGVDDDFFECGGTSLLAVQVASLLRARAIPISPQQIFELHTIGRIAGSIVAPRVASGDRVVLRAPPGRDATYATAVMAARWGATERVLLTGATGILGIHLLQELLACTRVEIVCLIRAGGDEAARARLTDQYRWYFGEAGVETLHARVEIAAGDLALPRLGLAVERWNALRSHCNSIVNAAADVRHVGRRDDLLRVNRDGVRELLRLAADGQSVRFHHVSTVAVRRYLEDQDEASAHATAGEGEVRAACDRGQHVYAESKLLAEQLVMGFVGAGGSASVLRVGTVAPHSVTGRFQRNIDDHFFSRYVRAMLDLGIACDEPPRHFRLIPVDAAARAIRLLAGSIEDGHLLATVDTPHELTQAGLVGILNRIGYPVALLDRRAYDRAVRSLGADSSRSAALGRLLPLVDEKRRGFRRSERSASEPILAASDFAYPKPTPGWIERFVRFGIDLGYFPAPGAAGHA